VVRASKLRSWTHRKGDETHFRYWPEVGATTPTSGLEVRTLANSTSNKRPLPVWRTERLQIRRWISPRPHDSKLGMPIGVYGFYIRFESQGHVTSGSRVMGVKNWTSDSALNFEPTFRQEGRSTWRWNLFALEKHYWEENIGYRFRKFNFRISRNLKSKLSFLIVWVFVHFRGRLSRNSWIEFLLSCTYRCVYSSSTIALHTTFPCRLSFPRYSSWKFTPIDRKTRKLRPQSCLHLENGTRWKSSADGFVFVLTSITMQY